MTDHLDHFDAHGPGHHGDNELHTEHDSFGADPFLGSSPLVGNVVHGQPDAAKTDWFLQDGQTCVPASVTQVIAEATDHPIKDESIVLHRMEELGFPPPGPDGTPVDQMVPLLQSFGIPAHLEHSSIPELERYLDEGRSIILAVDAHQIWNDAPSDGKANHAVLITAIDETTGMVTLSDTGTPDGNQLQVPLAQFESAWATSDYMLVVTDVQTVEEGEPAAPFGPVLVPLTVNPDFLPPSPDAGPAQAYTVQPGDTLWDIAEREYGDGAQWHRIADSNGITAPALIQPGQELTIPR